MEQSEVLPHWGCSRFSALLSADVILLLQGLILGPRVIAWGPCTYWYWGHNGNLGQWL